MEVTQLQHAKTSDDVMGIPATPQGYPLPETGLEVILRYHTYYITTAVP